METAAIVAIRALSVDDEPLARERLTTLLREHPDVVLEAELENGDDALEAIHELRPDLVFLDVQMPVMSGFDVARAIDPSRMPLIVFVTAFDQYALDAFRVSAVQYLLKPVDRDEFRNAMARVRQLMQSVPAGHQAIERLVEQLAGTRTCLRRIVVKSRGRTRLLKVEDVDWFESEGNYVRVHTRGESHLLRETMAALDQKLDPQQFVRIHRGTIVNIERVTEITLFSHGEYKVMLGNGTALTLSRNFRDRIEPLIGRL
jgi:two-component system LytT family response regulator